MFRKLYNQARVTGTLVPDGPFLIVQGGVPLDPTAPDLSFVRTRTPQGQTIYIPGSSLKGVVRAHAERLLATELGLAAAEDPFEFRNAPRRKKAGIARKGGHTAEVFQLSCPADRLFGSTEIAGRFRFEDALPEEGTEVVTEIRWGVAIDRAKQSARSAALFEQEAVTAGRFKLEATLENFPLWMLGLLLQCLQDLDLGLIRVGHSKSRGFGVLHLENQALEIRWPGTAPQGIEGAGARERDAATRAAYGLDGADQLSFPHGVGPVREGFFNVLRLEGEALQPLGSELYAGPWQRFATSERAAQQAAG